MTKRVEILWLSQEDVVAAGGLDIKAAVADVEEVFRLHGTGDYVLPAKIVLHWEAAPPGEQANHINIMPGYLGGRYQVVGLKDIASFPRNPYQNGLPRASALTILHSVETGLPLCVMDGTLISAVRTGAATAVGAKYLAGENVTRVGVIGAGVQARTQLMAVKAVRPRIREGMVYDLHRERAEAFATEMRQRLAIQLEVADDAESVVRQAEILVTATTTTRPIVEDGWLQPGSFYAHVSGYECTFDVLRHAHKVVVDDWEQVKHRMYSTVALMWRAGEFRDEHLYAELGEIVAGHKVGRTSEEEIIVFSPIGMGLHDLAVARRIYHTARHRGLGQRVTLWESPLWM
ncbi:MAG: ornithine cyclodeaminase [Caldilineae bacterium]|nr:MAG: ornithine cyclodeaminase [Caldilineae bacterium]